MEKNRLFGKDEFLGKLRPQMLTLGFRETGAKDFWFDSASLGLIGPRKRPGTQVGFLFYARGLKVQVWSTYVPTFERAKEDVNGWVMIKHHNAVWYFAPPLRRRDTDNFFDRLIKRAKACKERIENRPICAHCRRAMNIVRGPHFGSHYWECVFPKCDFLRVASRPNRLGFDYGLSPESLEFVRKNREARAGYRKAIEFYKLFCKLANFPYTPARVKRKKWKKTFPGNS